MHAHSLLAVLCLLSAPTGAQETPQGLVLHEDGAFEGYTLYAPLRSESTYLVDMEGKVAHQWSSDLTPGNSVYLLEDGTLLRCARTDSKTFRGGGSGGRIRQLAPDGEVLWELDWADEDKHHHHDIAPMPGGNVLLISWETIPADEAIRLGRDPQHTSEDWFWPDAVYEVRPTPPLGAEVVWEWHAIDHVIQDFDPDAAGYGDVTAHPERIDINGDHRDQAPLSAKERERRAAVEKQMRALGYVGDDEEEDEGEGNDRNDRRAGDWIHTNGIDYHPGLDLIVLSARSFSEIWVLDHSTTSAEAATSEGGRYGLGGDLLYRWGNPRMYGAGGAADRRLFVQHDAQWVGDGEDLRLTVFNNGQGRSSEPFSSVDEIALPFHPETGFARQEGTAFAPEEATWSYSAPDPTTFYSSFISGAQRLTNGNTLICSGAQGRLFEVTREGALVWDYHNPHGPSEDPVPPGPGTERPGPPPGRGEGRPDAGNRPGERRPEGGRGRQGGGGPGGMLSTGLFKATRIAPDHPGVQRLLGGDSR